MESIHFYVKVAKTGEKIFEVTISLRKGHDLLVRYLIKVELIVFRTQPCHKCFGSGFTLDPHLMGSRSQIRKNQA
jgi:hypothetical protein